MAKVKLEDVVFKVHCDCDKSFRAEDFTPQCPFCNRKYVVFVEGNNKQVSLKIKLA